MEIREDRYYTYEDWLKVKQENADLCVELIDGVIYIHDPPTQKHQMIAKRMYQQISDHLSQT